MTTSNKHLKKHHDTWVYSRRVPKMLKHLYPSQTHITYSLKTSSIKIARMKRDRINGQLASQMQNAYSLERIEFQDYERQITPWADALRDPEFPLDFDDFLPRNPIAKAAYRQTVYGDEQHAFTYTLREGLNSLLSHNGKLTEDTRRKLQNSVSRFLAFIGASDIPLKEISKKKVVDYVQFLGNDYAHGTITAHLSRLKSIWSHAYKRGEVANKVSPFCDHDLSAYKGEGSAQKQLFNDCQLKTVIKSCPSKLKDLVRLGLYTGARISELCKATEEKIEGIRCMVIKSGKTASAKRLIPLPIQVQDIELPLGLEAKSAGRDFSRFKTSEVTTDSTRSFHSLRVHFATAAQRAKVPEFDAAKILGHKTGETMSYGHYAKHDVKHLAETTQMIADQVDIEWL
ncbi:integrase family protein [Vibrio diabolicus E0666]|uniref:phage integrase SAM-like domain-containing protein n=1 Tax=Vibrio diabolicus TaxID=50719 RepID=UPI0002B7097F|nr:phage integrase SAM-like domain-containing protein [Vibrio diabolicus]EMD78786.1 integrase family protein [Vibrio diabolicus E0666]